MKSWSVGELDNVVRALGPLLGARLQEVRSNETDFVLGFYGEGRLLWLWMDLNPVFPTLLPWSEPPVTLAAKKSPMQLFLRAHFVGQTLLTVERPEGQGRLVRLHFSGDRTLEVRLFPRGENLLASASGKQVSLSKPHELKPLREEETGSPGRSLEELRDEWRTRRSSGRRGKTSALTPQQKLDKQIAKKRSALEKVEDELRRKTDLPWREVGLWMKQEQSVEVPEKWAPFVDKRRKLSWNIDQCFQRARENEQKALGTERRRQALVAEIATLLTTKVKDRDVEGDRPILKPLKKGDMEARSLRINDEIIAYVGKNAADNLKLLRKARPWDFWMHLQDRPGAHCILFRNKSTSVSDAALAEVVAWFVKMQFGAKLSHYSQEKMPVLVAECRHVRPIKGDRLGRVHYAHERILIYQVP